MLFPYSRIPTLIQIGITKRKFTIIEIVVLNMMW